jgi:hypothetical protein
MPVSEIFEHEPTAATSGSEADATDVSDEAPGW